MLTKWMMFVLCIKSQASSQVGVVLLGCVNVYCPESPRRGRVCPMVDSNSDCRYSCGVYNHEKLPMPVNSSYSFSYGPKKPWCSVVSVFLTRHVTSASINLVTRRVTLASTSS